MQFKRINPKDENFVEGRLTMGCGSVMYRQALYKINEKLVKKYEKEMKED